MTSDRGRVRPRYRRTVGLAALHSPPVKNLGERHHRVEERRGGGAPVGVEGRRHRGGVEHQQGHDPVGHHADGKLVPAASHGGPLGAQRELQSARHFRTESQRGAVHRVPQDRRSVSNNQSITHRKSGRVFRGANVVFNGCFAASFSFPLLRREKEAGPGGESAFWCHSSGGFPAPAVYWLINDTEDPPDGSVRTLAAALPDSLLYNVTSQLMLNVSEDSSVSCVVENPSMNENLTSTTSGVKVRGGPVVTGRASEAMWIFSTALCAVVGVMVLVGVIYQIHLDRMSKKKKEFHKQHLNRGYKRRRPEEEAAMKPEKKETDV
ncbi:uncharacterized protein LOC116378426 isoform X2 [Anarrhichthys ocellatus]|uniref:uncharacterized protein LOC116378426 isoform X2 n=1 Tax=Anarrhichthys ocellatus TaxID=433405 RepID=UPI0012EE8B50|nr:uncharacterized protein LOC116378426 isoform X2 [Anarrhichthys ocellatus]